MMVKNFLVFLCLVALSFANIRPEPKGQFKSICAKNPEHCAKQKQVFPEMRGQVLTYTSMYDTDNSLPTLLGNFDFTTPQYLKLQEKEDKDINPPRIDTIVEGKVYQARGYALGWPLVIVTPEDKLIIVDFPESKATGELTLSLLRAIPAIGTKPIVALVYTIFHADHVWGVEPFVKDQYSNEADIKIYAHQNLLMESRRYELFKTFKQPRAFRQFGVFVPSPWYVNSLAAERLSVSGPYEMLYPPTDPIHFPYGQNTISMTVAGLNLEFISIPGYTSDQMMVYVEAFDLMHASDAFYSSFPNLYALRGEIARDALKWADGTRTAASYEPAILTLTHEPVRYGKEEIKETLNNYADAIQFVHDQTIRFMTKGYSADVIPREIELPQHLRDLPYLQEYYGMLDVSIKGIVDFYVGWFSGYVEDLFPVDRFERAARMVDLVGKTNMEMAAGRAYNNGQYEWALELSSLLLNGGNTNAIALDIRTESLKRMAEVHPSIIGRNYLLATLMEDWGIINNKVNSNSTYLLLHLEGAFQQLGFHLNPEAADGRTASLNLVLQHEDSSQSMYFLNVYNSVMKFKEVTTPEPGVTVFATTELYWRLGCARFLPNTPMSALGNVLSGSVDDVEYFMSMFDLDDEINGYVPPDFGF